MDLDAQTVTYRWKDSGEDHVLGLIHVAGCVGKPYSFGSGQPTKARPVEVRDFFMATLPVTQALWAHVMGENPSVRQGMNLPLENVSWDVIQGQGGFLERINESAVHGVISRQIGSRAERFRLPTESEWEYAARGGLHWIDGFQFSGSDDIDTVAWYERKHGDHTQPVGLKAPNQLGIHDMSGNVWEWCQDVYTAETDRIPIDGSALAGDGAERVLRGGCFHNWAIHCTVSKRYAIGHECHDGCIGFRLVFGLEQAAE